MDEIETRDEYGQRFDYRRHKGGVQMRVESGPWLDFTPKLRLRLLREAYKKAFGFEVEDLGFLVRDWRMLLYLEQFEVRLHRPKPRAKPIRQMRVGGKGRWRNQTHELTQKRLVEIHTKHCGEAPPPGVLLGIVEG